MSAYIPRGVCGPTEIDAKRERIAKAARACITYGSPLTITALAKRCGAGHRLVRDVLEEQGLEAALTICPTHVG